MSKNGVFKKPALEQSTILDRTAKAKITLKGTTAGDTGIVGYADCESWEVVTEEGVAVTDAGAGLPTLDDDADPAVIGIGILCGDADYLQAFSIDLDSVSTTGSSLGAVTAFAVTWEGTGVTGVSALFNIWVSVSITGPDLDSAIGTVSFVCRAEYKARRG